MRKLRILFATSFIFLAAAVHTSTFMQRLGLLSFGYPAYYWDTSAFEGIGL